MIRQRRRAAAYAVLACTSVVLCTVGLARTSAARAQSAPYFSPTYAASEGSPYSSIYAQTFGAGGPPASQAPAASAAPAPLETAAGPAAPPESGVVYVIEDGRLLTYRAEDYAQGGQALAGTAVPPAPSGAADLSSIADRLYEAAPLETAAGPIPLVPPRKPDGLGN